MAGRWPPARDQLRPGRVTAYPRSAILQVDERKVNGGVTALLGLAILGAVAIAVISVGNNFGGGLGY